MSGKVNVHDAGVCRDKTLLGQLAIEDVELFVSGKTPSLFDQQGIELGGYGVWWGACLKRFLSKDLQPQKPDWFV